MIKSPKLKFIVLEYKHISVLDPRFKKTLGAGLKLLQLQARAIFISKDYFVLLLQTERLLDPRFKKTLGAGLKLLQLQARAIFISRDYFVM
jgi:hypothetical protein